MSLISRRRFLQTGSAATLLATLPFGRVFALSPSSSGVARQRIAQTRSTELKLLLQTGLDSAIHAGATYADIVFCFQRNEEWDKWSGTIYPTPTETLHTSVGIRALVNGYWGFAGLDGIVSSDRMARLGRDAVTYAKIGAQGTPRVVDLAPVPAAASGEWVMPVAIDPFEVSYDEKIDLISAMCDYMVRNRVGVKVEAVPAFTKTERAFASTDGAFANQITYTSQCRLSVYREFHFRTGRIGIRSVDFLKPAGAGWEHFREAPYQEFADQLVKEASDKRSGKPIDIGRWDTIFDAAAMVGIVDRTIGAATELDRVMGYEANGVGTSFLNDPLALLGAHELGSSLVNISANRSMPGGAATVKWDDEGVEPREVALVRNGILNDFQTTRESASWIAPYYDRIGQPTRSNGCAGRDKASLPTNQCPPNFELGPGNDDVTFEDLIADTERGYAVVGGYTWMDQQALNGSGIGDVVYEVRNGKLVAPVQGAEYLLRTPEFWKSVVGVGGSRSQRRIGVTRGRTREFLHPHTVAAVPVKVSQLAFTEFMRRA